LPILQPLNTFSNLQTLNKLRLTDRQNLNLPIFADFWFIKLFY